MFRCFVLLYMEECKMSIPFTIVLLFIQQLFYCDYIFLPNISMNYDENCRYNSTGFPVHFILQINFSYNLSVFRFRRESIFMQKSHYLCTCFHIFQKCSLSLLLLLLLLRCFDKYLPAHKDSNINSASGSAPGQSADSESGCSPPDFPDAYPRP